jgi:uncharacterized protein (DUF697 family)
MTDAVRSTIHKTSAATAVIGAVLSPLPLVDELVLAPVLAVLAKRIAGHHGLAASAMPWRAIARTGVNGLVARAVANLAVSYIPGVAAVANAATAALLTELVGAYVDEACADPEKAQPLGVKAIVERLRAGLAAAV